MTVTTYSSTPLPRRRKSAAHWVLRALGVLILVLVIWRVYTVGMAENYPASFWISQALNGLVLGGVYALVALGYTLVYGILLMINFAHGEVVMIGGFAGFFALQFFTAIGWLEGSAALVAFALLLIVGAGMLASVLTGVTLERVAYRPLRGAPRLVPLISAIGASLFLQYSVLLIFGVSPRVYQKPALIAGGFRVERFYRADRAHSTRGFGLGLPIAKKIIELHDGEIRVKSEVGRGSLFTVILPYSGSL